MGCLELYISRAAPKKSIGAGVGGFRKLSTEIVTCRESDEHAAGVIDELLEAFRARPSNMIDILDPKAQSCWAAACRICRFSIPEGVERVRKYVFNDELLHPIAKHELGDSAGSRSARRSSSEMGDFTR